MVPSLNNYLGGGVGFPKNFHQLIHCVRTGATTFPPADEDTFRRHISARAGTWTKTRRHFEDTWNEDEFPPGGLLREDTFRRHIKRRRISPEDEFLREDTFRIHIKRRRISPRRRITPRRHISKTHYPPKTKTHFEDALNEDKKRTPRRARFCFHIFKQLVVLNDKQFHKKRGVTRKSFYTKRRMSRRVELKKRRIKIKKGCITRRVVLNEG